jgi:polycystin 1L2
MMLSTTHLTSFGTGFFVKPNLVDFSYVFANAGFTDNLTIYFTLIFTVAVYILLVIWARIKDKKDKEAVNEQKSYYSNIYVIIDHH